MHAINQLRLISFHSRLVDCPAFQSAIEGLHFPSTSVTCEDFLSENPGNHNQLDLLILGREVLDDQSALNKISDCLQRSSKTINLCLIDDSQSHNIPTLRVAEFFANFHDLIFWPCSRQEICARIQRFCTAPQKGLVILDRSMLEQFVKLNLVGESPVFMRTLALIKKVATCNAPVLIEGETGTGKENAARAIHYMSDRRDNGFVPVNCGALPDELLENELFGHEKGAFTDAKNSQAGLVNIASGGTLFLDEVDSLSPKAQAALLRFLQTQEYRPLGSRVTRYADVRILAASNSKLSDKVADKKFREDLLFRLNVLNVHMPALRERSNDIALITDALLKRFARSQGTPQKFLSPFSVYWLQRHSWPGNVRELENLLFRQFVLCEGNCIHIQDSPDFAANQHDDATEPAKQENILNFQAAKAAAIQQFEKSYLTNILARTDGNISEAARISGKERRALGKMLKKYDIDKETFYH